jgi:tetratricopeptide (TPR) repeat protein
MPTSSSCTQQFLYEFTEQSLTATLDCLERALAIDPAYAQAMAMAAYCHAERRLQGWTRDPPSEIAAGIRLALRAAELGLDNGNALWMAGFAIWHLALDAQRGKDLAYRSLKLNPNSASAIATAAWIEATTGQSAKALELSERAERLSPRDPRGWVIAVGFCSAYLAERRFKDAVAWAEKALLQNPRSAVALRILAAGLAQLGMTDRAAATLRQALTFDHQLTISNLRARLPFMAEALWNTYAGGLRLAGLPE